MKRIAKIVLLAVSLLAFGGAVVIGITQTAVFRSWLRGYVLNLADQNLNAKLSFGAIHGNLITGIRIDSLTVTLDGATVFTCTDALVRYNPARIPSQYLALAEVSIHDPKIFLWRGVHDSVWNFERIAKPTGKPPQEFTWTIEGNDVELQNGTIAVCDSSAPETTDSLISPLRETLHGVNASLACRITENVQDVAIYHLSLQEPVTGFHLRDMAGTLYHADDSSRVQLTRMETDNSRLALDITAGNPGKIAKDTVLKNILAKTPFTIDIDADKLSFRDAKLFSPALAAFDSTCGLTLDAHGTPEEMTITKCELKLNRSDLVLAGTVRHLTDPDDIAGDIKISKSLIVSDEVFARTGRAGFPDLRYLGDVKIATANAKGSMKDASLSASVATAIGSANCDGKISFKDSLPNMNVRAIFTHVNLSPINPASMPVSNIAGQIQITGKGKSFASFTGTAALDLLPTQIAGRNIDHASLRCGLDREQIRIDTLKSVLASGNGEFSIHGSLDLRGTPHYQLQLVTAGLNVAGITLDQKITSLNTVMDVTGEGLTMDSLLVNPLAIHMTESKIYGRDIPAFTANIAMTRELGDSVTTELTSDLGTIKIHGIYTIDRLIDKLNSAGNTIAALVTDSIVPAFNAFPAPATDLIVSRQTPWLFQDKRPINANFQIALTNPSLLSAFLETNIGSRAFVKGTLRSDSANVQTTLRAVIGGFTLDNDSASVHMTKTRLRLDMLQYLLPVASPFVVERTHSSHNAKTFLAAAGADTVNRIQHEFSIDVSTDSLVVNDMPFSHPHAVISYNKGSAQYNASTGIGAGSPVVTQLNGKGTFSNVPLEDSIVREFRTDIDSAMVKYGTRVQWFAASPMDIGFTHGQIDFHSAQMKSDGTVLSWSGKYNAPEFHDLDITLRQFPLQTVPYYMNNSSLEGLRGIMQTIHCKVNGTVDDPLVDVDTIQGNGIEFKSTDFGSLNAAFRYADKNVAGDVHLATEKRGNTSADTSHRVDITVAQMPLDLAFHAVEQRIPDNAPVIANVNAVSFPIAFLELIVGETVDQLHGYATGGITINGMTPRIRYAGDLKAEDIHFHTRSTNIYYHGRADVQLRNDTLQIVRSTLYNGANDLPDGSASVWGDLYFKGFVFDSFDLWASTDQMLVLSDASRTLNSSVYGRLVISTQPPKGQNANSGTNALHFYGTFNAPTLDGNVYITESNLTFPQTQQTEQGGGYDVVYDLSAAERKDTTTSSLAPGTANEGNSNFSPQVVFTGGLLDRMRFNLHIETKEDLHMEMDFGPTERLQNVFLSGSLDYHRDAEGKVSLFGPLYINGGIYSFFDQFHIDQGSVMRFIDSVENPQLDITARTTPRLHIQQGGAQQYVQVEVHITGTRKEPRMELTLLEGQNSNSLVEQAQNADNQTKALLFLASGQFPEDFNAGSGTAGASYTFAATTLSQSLNKMFHDLGWGGNVNLQYDPSNPNVLSSKVNVSFQVGKLLVSAGAHAISPTNLDASVTFSLGDILGVVWLEQTRIIAQRSATEVGSGGVASSAVPPQNAVLSARIGAGDFIQAMGNLFGAFWKLCTNIFSSNDTHSSAPAQQSSTKVDSSEAVNGKK